MQEWTRMRILIVSRRAVSFLLFVLWASTGFAGFSPSGDILYRTGPNNHGLWPSDLSDPAGPGLLGQFADTVALPEISAVSSVTFWGVYFESDPGVLPEDSFTLRFYGTTGGVPGAVPQISVPMSDTTREVYIAGIPGITASIYRYTARFADVLLPDGVLGISIVNDLRGDPLYWSVGLSQDLSGDGFARGSDGEDWSPVMGELAIELRGTIIPEPSTAAMLALGCAWLVHLGGRQGAPTRSV